MKKIVAAMAILALVILLMTGCTGINASVATNIATDVAFVSVLQNNPGYKVPVVSALQGIKVFLGGEVTYDQLVQEISRQFGGQYAYVGSILLGYIDSDTPISTSAINLLGSYKDAVTAKIDRLLILAAGA